MTSSHIWQVATIYCSSFEMELLLLEENILDCGSELFSDVLGKSAFLSREVCRQRQNGKKPPFLDYA